MTADVDIVETQPPAPGVVARPALARWIWERGLDYPTAAAAIGVSPQSVWLYCLPFADPRRTSPRKLVAERIAAWTDGAVAPESFRPAGASDPS